MWLRVFTACWIISYVRTCRSLAYISNIYLGGMSHTNRLIMPGVDSRIIIIGLHQMRRLGRQAFLGLAKSCFSFTNVVQFPLTTWALGQIHICKINLITPILFYLSILLLLLLAKLAFLIAFLCLYPIFELLVLLCHFYHESFIQFNYFSSLH